MADESKVVGLDGRPVADGPDVDERLVEVLEALLADARKGELTSVAVATVWSGAGCATSFHVGRRDSCVVLMGSVARLLNNLNRQMDEREQER